MQTSSGTQVIFLFFFPLEQNLYESIKNEPFKIPEDDGNDLTHTFFNPDREGWLLKLGELGGGTLRTGLGWFHKHLVKRHRTRPVKALFHCSHSASWFDIECRL